MASGDPSEGDASASVVDPTARLTYRGAGIEDVDPAAGPWDVVRRWYAEATQDERVVEPGAMVVATVDVDGRPDARTVLLKGLQPRGFEFYTNLTSAKARQLADVPRASLVLLWHPMYRQVRVRGDVEQVAREESAAYFAARPRGSQLAAWASHQSQPVRGRDDLLAAAAAAEERFAGGDVPLPDFWGGYRVRPVEVEVWVGQESRLHDRLTWTTRDGAPAPMDAAAAWTHERRQP